MNDSKQIQNLDRKLILSHAKLDGQVVKDLTAAGMAWLNTNKQIVNALNVFPVPDGDTGTNMMLTMQSAFDEIENSPENHAGKMFGAVAQGALMGARGNSGVILSQIWRGIASAMKDEEYLTSEGHRYFPEWINTTPKGWLCRMQLWIRSLYRSSKM